MKTALVLFDSVSGEEISHLETTFIRFRTLSREEIEAYVATGDPLDKAGSYGIQGKAGDFVEKIDGDFDNVVGLPVQVLARIVQAKGWEFA